MLQCDVNILMVEMGNYIDLTEKRFGKLTVLYRSKNNKKGTYWHCKCDCGNEKDVLGSNLKSGNVRSCGCLAKIKSSYNYEINQKINGYEITDRYRKNGKKRYIYKCLICGYKNDVPEGRITHSHGCPVCNGRIILQGFNDLKTTNPEIAKMLKNSKDVDGKSKYSKDKVDWICPNCHKTIYQKQINNVVKSGLFCPFCSDGNSYSNKLMSNILNYLNEVSDFKTEYSPDWIKPRRYDFYIPKYKLIIEMDGGLGHGNDDSFGLSAEDSLSIDKYKDSQAKKHDLDIIRIDCNYKNFPRFEYIKKSILSSDLKNFFNMSKIDWNYIYKKTNSSKMMDFISYVNSTKNKSLGKLCKEYGIPKTTGRRYVDRGIEQGICKYKFINCKKEIAQFNLNGNIVNIYPSIKDAARKNSCNAANISQCLCGNRNIACGFQWKYYTGVNKINPYSKKTRDYSKQYKKVCQYDINGILLNIYESIREAEKITNVDHSMISRCCKNKQKTAGGYIWKYADEIEESNLAIAN